MLGIARDHTTKAGKMQMGQEHEAPSPSTVESARVELAQPVVQRPVLPRQTPLNAPVGLAGAPEPYARYRVPGERLPEIRRALAFIQVSRGSRPR